nr:D-alanyl-D-alanine carboxypeptidase family protein [Anaeromonas gelatinilytica]
MPIILILLFVFNFTSVIYANDNFLNPSDINAESAILIDGNTGEILFEKNIDKKMYPASTTKILTGILAIENGNFNDMVTVDAETPYEIKGAHIALEPDEKINFEDLLNATLIESANDAAVVLAKHIGGSVEGFAKMMNDKAQDIGAKNSNFVNPNGLPDENHTTTAYDLAIITKYAMKNEKFREIVKNHQYTIEPTNKKTEQRHLHSSNKLLYGTSNINVDGKTVEIKYDDAIGVKTGYTDEAGQCLVSAVERDGRMLISVVLKSTGNNLWIDTHKLLDYGFNNFTTTILGFKNEFVKNIEIKNGNNSFVTGVNGKDVSITLPKGTKNSVTKNIILNDNLEAPISKGQVLGKIEYILNDEVITTSNIISTSDIKLMGVYASISNSSLFSNFYPWLLIGLPILFIIWSFSTIRKKIKKKKYATKSDITYKEKY